MPKLNQRGVIQLFVILILIAGLVAAVYLVQKTTFFKPKASVSGPITSTTSFSFWSGSPGANVGDLMAVKILVRSDIAAANLFNAKITFPADTVAVDHIDYAGTFVNSWVEQYFDNSAGTISLVGGAPNPGFSTDISSSAGQMAVIYFRALNPGTATISFSDTSQIYSNVDNTDILVSKNPISLSFASGGVNPTPSQTTPPTPTPMPTAVPTPAITPTSAPIAAGTGDGNGDGKINLVDLSILLSDFNKTSGFRPGVDLNGDGRINTFDFSLMRTLLIQKGVVRG